MFSSASARRSTRNPFTGARATTTSCRRRRPRVDTTFLFFKLRGEAAEDTKEDTKGETARPLSSPSSPSPSSPLLKPPLGASLFTTPAYFSLTVSTARLFATDDPPALLLVLLLLLTSSLVAALLFSSPPRSIRYSRIPPKTVLSSAGGKGGRGPVSSSSSSSSSYLLCGSLPAFLLPDAWLLPALGLIFFWCSAQHSAST
mmetsp:Transcript_13377/g.24737  ORF Transcript_13377/g.24737 Transcript_13377/m.24737 type:complete len:201 (-) Transcript_13377:291-893(-)